jgi:hypothetical protein
MTRFRGEPGDYYTGVRDVLGMDRCLGVGADQDRVARERLNVSNWWTNFPLLRCLIIYFGDHLLDAGHAPGYQLAISGRGAADV